MDGAAPLEELYDEATVAALDAWRPAAAPSRTGEPARRRPSALRRGAAAATLTATALALREVLEGEADDPEVVELRPDAGRADERWVTFLHVPGAPRMSRIVVRPWLAPTA